MCMVFLRLTADHQPHMHRPHTEPCFHATGPSSCSLSFSSCPFHPPSHTHLPIKVIFFGFIRLDMMITSSFMPAMKVWVHTGR